MKPCGRIPITVNGRLSIGRLDGNLFFGVELEDVDEHQIRATRGEHVTRDPAQGVQRMQQACDASVGEACFELARMYDNAEGVARDLQRALALYKQGCAAGLEQACAKSRYR